MSKRAPAPPTENDQRHKQQRSAHGAAFHQHLHVAILGMGESEGAGIIEISRTDILMRTGAGAQKWKVFERHEICLPNSEPIVHQLIQALIASEQFHGALERILPRSEEHTSELQSLRHLVCRL